MVHRDIPYIYLLFDLNIHWTQFSHGCNIFFLSSLQLCWHSCFISFNQFTNRTEKINITT